MDPQIMPIAALTASKRLSCVELIRFAAKRIETINGDLNAVTTLAIDRALQRARELDNRAGSDGEARPLLGLPVLVKETENAAGFPTTYGSRASRGTPPSSFSDEVPARLENAGAIIIGKTNTPEHAFEAYSSNPLFGATLNPWARSLSPGGSSGGAAVALVTGMIPIATGTDGGGSVRIPAALCGLIGLKPTRGFIGRWPTHPWMDFSSNGFLGLTSEDVLAQFRLASGQIGGDLWSNPLLASTPRPRFTFRKIVAFYRNVDWGPLPRDVEALFMRELEALRKALDLDLDVRPTAIFPAERANPDDDWFTVTTAEHFAWLGRDFVDAHKDEFDPVFLGYLTRGRACSLGEYITARRNCYQYSRTLDALLEQGTLVVTPTVASSGFSPGGHEQTDGASPEKAPEPDTVPLDPSAVNTVLQNMTGHPAISLPAGALPNGWRFGLQLTGPRGSDEDLIGLAELWRRHSPWELTAAGYTTFLEALSSPRST